MFTTPNVAAFMQNASIEGRKEKKVIRFTFYITPIKHALAAEVSPAMADRLFTFDKAGTPQPVTEMDSPHFNIGRIDLQHVILNGSDDPKMAQHGTMLESAQISHIIARKLFLPDSPDFSLIFRVEVPFNDLGFEMIKKYYDEKLFLTFEPMQLSLEENQVPTCEECDNPAVCRDSEDNYFCEKDRKNAVGEVTYIAKAESPAEKAAREEEDRKDTSHINRKKK